MTTKLVPFVMYLDPEDKEDQRLIRHLRPKIKRRKVSSEIRTGMLFYLDYLRNNGSVQVSRQIEADWSTETDAMQLRSSVVAQEAARTFLKRRE